MDEKIDLTQPIEILSGMIGPLEPCQNCGGTAHLVITDRMDWGWEPGEGETGEDRPTILVANIECQDCEDYEPVGRWNIAQRVRRMSRLEEFVVSAISTRDPAEALDAAVGAANLFIPFGALPPEVERADRSKWNRG